MRFNTSDVSAGIRFSLLLTSDITVHEEEPLVNIAPTDPAPVLVPVVKITNAGEPAVPVLPTPNQTLSPILFGAKPVLPVNRFNPPLSPQTNVLGRLLSLAALPAQKLVFPPAIFPTPPGIVELSPVA